MTGHFIDAGGRSPRLLGAIFVFGLATGAIFPLVALQLESRGFGDGFVGVVTSIYYLGSFIGVLTFGRVLRVLGYRAAFGLAAGVAAAATLGLRGSDEAAEWIVLRFAGGYALGSYYVVVESWVTALASRRTRGRSLALYESVRLLATAIGPSLIVVGAAHAGMLFVAVAYAVSILPACLTEAPPDRNVEPLHLEAAVDIVRCFPHALVLVFASGLTTASFYGLGALYASHMGLEPSAIALFVVIVLLAPLATELPFGAVGDRLTRMSVAAPSAATALLAATVLSLAPPANVAALCVLGAVVGGCMVPLYALGLSRMVDSVEASRTVSVTTSGLVTYNVGAFIGPGAAGVAMQFGGPGALYACIGLVSLTAFLAAAADVFAPVCCPETVE